MGILTNISGGGGGGAGAPPKSPLIQDSANTLYTVGGTESALIAVREGSDPAQIDGVNVLLAAGVTGYVAPIATVTLIHGDVFLAGGASSHIQRTWFQNTSSVVARVRMSFDAGAFSSSAWEHFGFASCLVGESTGVVTNNTTTFTYSGASTETGGPLGLQSGILYNSGNFNGNISSGTCPDYVDITGQTTFDGPAPVGGHQVYFDILPGHDFRTMFQQYQTNGTFLVLGVIEFELLGSDVIGTTIGGSGDWTNFILCNGATFQGGQYIVTEYDN